ncbi:hypothetical protein QS468_25635 [Bacillus subtilis]|nr:hypothetical protein [Pseudomonas sp. A29(2023)]MDL5596123.1 hypothetical protein [Bacillus subtilis]
MGDQLAIQGYGQVLDEPSRFDAAATGWVHQHQAAGLELQPLGLEVHVAAAALLQHEEAVRVVGPVH